MGGNKDRTSKGKKPMPSGYLSIKAGNRLKCGSALKIKGKLDRIASEKARYLCLLCDEWYDTPNQHKQHNNTPHPNMKICKECLHPTTTPERHEFPYLSNAISRLTKPKDASSTSEEKDQAEEEEGN